LRDEHGYPGCHSIVRDAVRRYKQSQAEVFVPLLHRPGEAQADFGRVEVVVAGCRTKAALFVLTLPYSNARFGCLFPRECTETFHAGHARAFDFFGGVPTRISYDNSKIAVTKFTGLHERCLTREFLRLQAHFAFNTFFCRVRQAHEKGHVENGVGYVRRNFLVPVPQADSWDSLNTQLASACQREFERAAAAGQHSTAELLAADRAAFLPLPAEPFEARRVALVTINSLSLGRFDGNDYSVPTAFAYQSLTATGTIDHVRFSQRGLPVAEHRRLVQEAGAVRAVALPGAVGTQAGGVGPRPAAWQLVVAGGVRRVAASSGGKRSQRGDKGVHSGPASVGEPRTEGGECGRRARPDAGARRRRLRALTAGVRPGAAGPGFRPGQPTPAVGGLPAGARPGCLRCFDLHEGGEAMKAKRVVATDLVLLKHHLSALHLPTVKAECEQLARQCASDNIDHLGFLLRLCERESADRQRRACERRVKAARFPQVKSLDEFDFTAQPSLNRVLVLELARCAFIDRRESVILVGGPGTGKTHVAIGLAAAACQRGKKVRFFRVSELLTLLLEAREERVLSRLRSQLARLELLVLDEFGYVPASGVGAELLFDVISTAYEKTSVILTTNLPFQRWTEVLGNERLVGATLDRLTHRCHLLEATGESYRIKEARRRRQGSTSGEGGARQENE